MKAVSLSVVQLITSDIPRIRPLLEDYLQFLRDIDMMDGGGDELVEELQALDASYSGDGEGWFAMFEDDEAVGCAMLRRIDGTRGEICRVYVTPQMRGQGLAARMMEAVIDHARRTGYQSLWLDTFRKPDDAQHLYRKLGFQPCAPYHDGPEHKLLFFTKSL